MDSSLSGPDLEVESLTPPRSTNVRRVKTRSFNLGWMLIPGAIAAAILATVIPRPTFTDQSGAVTDATNGQTTMLPSVMPTVMPSVARDGRGGSSDLMRPVSVAPSVRRRTGRDLIGVVGDDGNLYWIEVERTRTIKLPRRRPVSSGSLNEL